MGVYRVLGLVVDLIHFGTTKRPENDQIKDVVKNACNVESFIDSGIGISINVEC